MVTQDTVALQLHGNAIPAQPYTAVGDSDVPLLYGRTYDLRVRLMDLSRGGPTVTDNAINPAPAPICVFPFRRLVPFKSVTITNLDPDRDGGRSANHVSDCASDAELSGRCIHRRAERRERIAGGSAERAGAAPGSRIAGS